jgi:hypothetical protein
MGQREEAILFFHPEVVSGVILVVMRIDNDIWMKGV